MVKNSNGTKGNRHFWFADDNMRLPCTLILFINYPNKDKKTRGKNRRAKSILHIVRCNWNVE